MLKLNQQIWYLEGDVGGSELEKWHQFPVLKYPRNFSKRQVCSVRNTPVMEWNRGRLWPKVGRFLMEKLKIAEVLKR